MARMEIPQELKPKIQNAYNGTTEGRALTLLSRVDATSIIAQRQPRFLGDSVSVTDLDAAMLRLYVECNVKRWIVGDQGFVLLKKNDGNSFSERFNQRDGFRRSNAASLR